MPRNLFSCIDELKEGEPMSHAQLELIPLLGLSQGPEVDSLTKALADGVACITEVSDGGSVPGLRALNNGPGFVLIVDGEELIGAKQNRVLNTSVLLSPGTSVVLPVSCIEHGRWSRVSSTLSSKERVIPSSLRRAKTGRVSDHLSANRGYAAGQGAVWADVERYSSARGVRSPTSALSDALDHDEDEAERFVDALRCQDGQVGVAAYIAGRLAGIDVFGRPDTYAATHARLVRSYAFEALLWAGRPQANIPEAAPTQAPLSFLHAALDAKSESRRSPGAGQDIRFRRPLSEAAALTHDDALVHLTVFPR